MESWKTVGSSTNWRRAIVALGTLYVVLGLGWAYVEISQGTPLSNAVIISFFVAGPGMVVLYGGYRLPETEINPKFYSRIIGWCLGGIGVLTGLLTLYHLQPAASIGNPGRAILIISAFVLVPSFAGGLNDARAKSNAFVLERTVDLLHKSERIANVGGWEIDPATMEVYWTQHLFEILERPWDEEPPMDETLEVYHEDDQPIIKNAIEAALEDGEPFDMELRFYTPEGEARWLRVQGIPETVGGDVVSLRGAAQDITERKEHEQELQRVRERMEFALNATDAVVWDWNVETNEALFYPSAESLYGTTVENWEDFVEVIHPEDRERVQQTIEHSLETGDPKHEEIRIVRDGEIRWIEAPGYPVETDDGSKRMIGVARDITDRKTYERRLEESNERLEQFAYAASHDLQEPLRMISSYLQLIESRADDELTEETEEFLEFAVDGAERMRDMIDGLLAYSRVETQGEPFEPIDLNEVVADVRDNLDVRFTESDADVEVGELPPVLGDENQLHQVFQNLLSNAIEYSGDEPPQVRISAERNGSMWEVSVQDEGIGIEPDEQDLIFEVFQRLHSQDDYEGSGIGLALCERIVERHGGEIWVNSEPGMGSTFTFTLPPEDARAE
ncbi:ATP-binding protein [Natronoglomus mannanivorans]|uniref:histidine kinase n=1 Tax=Natronoglomus mannanivorans TaxID=2979990 RepID=A0AAP2Z170_9EURY|nr:ATP-binding protein [Halobacteria archaeon AArc-xg1-1]